MAGEKLIILENLLPRLLYISLFAELPSLVSWLLVTAKSYNRVPEDFHFTPSQRVNWIFDVTEASAVQLSPLWFNWVLCGSIEPRASLSPPRHLRCIILISHFSVLKHISHSQGILHVESKYYNFTPTRACFMSNLWRFRKFLDLFVMSERRPVWTPVKSGSSATQEQDSEVTLLLFTRSPSQFEPLIF